MNVSVVVPVLNEADKLETCLDRVTDLVSPGDELIIVDGGSTDGTVDIAESFDGVTVVEEPDGDDGGGKTAVDSLRTWAHDAAQVFGPDVSRARQYGANLSKNPIVATTDADTKPPEDWLDRIRSHFENDDDLSVVWGTVTDTNGVPVRDLTAKFSTLLGGVSGCNTAFRKSHFNQLDRGYLGWPTWEDVALISRLAREGKAVHDRDLEMRMNLERGRYQTMPMLAAGGAGVIAGTVIGGPLGALAAGCGAGVGGTELVYEHAAGIRPQSISGEPTTHHDQFGLGLMLTGLVLGGAPGIITGGVGTGIVAHHILTEGASAIPTDLMANTDEVCSIDADAGDGVTVTCEPADDTESKVTRALAASVVGAAAGRGLSMVSTTY